MKLLRTDHTIARIPLLEISLKQNQRFRVCNNEQCCELINDLLIITHSLNLVSGQKYFQNNRFGVMTSNLYGLFSLISEPVGVKVLDMTQKSSTAETARKRYVATTLHMLSWYQDELKPGSK